MVNAQHDGWLMVDDAHGTALSARRQSHAQNQ